MPFTDVIGSSSQQAQVTPQVSAYCAPGRGSLQDCSSGYGRVRAEPPRTNLSLKHAPEQRIRAAVPHSGYLHLISNKPHQVLDLGKLPPHPSGPYPEIKITLSVQYEELETSRPDEDWSRQEPRGVETGL